MKMSARRLRWSGANQKRAARLRGCPVRPQETAWKFAVLADRGRLNIVPSTAITTAKHIVHHCSKLGCYANHETWVHVEPQAGSPNYYLHNEFRIRL